MSYHDDIKDAEEILSDPDFVKVIAPKYREASADLDEIFDKGADSNMIAMLLFKLVEERQQSNQLLQQVFDKLETAVTHLEQQTSLEPNTASPNMERTLHVLPEQDQLILHLVDQKGQVTADEVKIELGYKGTNAASQRLNKLYKDGHLKKMQAGRKVVFLAKSN